jgi:hypothetical protein
VDDFELTVGDRTIKGEIKRRDEARAVYHAAMAAGYQAALAGTGAAPTSSRSRSPTSSPARR